MTRREWLRECGAAGALCLGGCATLKGAGCENYSVIVLGDTHYDTAPASVFHAAYPGKDVDARLEEIQRAEFARNGEMWRDRCPRLLAAAKRQRTADTAFAIQVGDLIQGDCNDGAVHAKMASAAFDLLKKGLGGDLPLFLVVGNHDIRNGRHDDAAGFYRDWMVKRMTEENRAPVASTNYARMQGRDLWIFVDFTAPDLKMIEAALAAHKDARYRFLVTHGPALPSDCRSSRWMLFGGRRDEERRALRKLLMANDMIVVAGHTHTTELLEFRSGDGHAVQIIANSVWKSDDLATVAPQYTTVDQYGTLQEKEDGKTLLAEYKPSLTRTWRSSAAGFFRLEVSDAGVRALFFGGDAATPRETWRLR